MASGSEATPSRVSGLTPSDVLGVKPGSTYDICPPPLTGAEALADAIAAEGTEVVFGVLGDGNLYFVPRLVERHGVRFVAARHEAAAVSMADGYARTTGQLGVCTVTHGPGLTQTGTPLTAARIARSPMLLVAGDTARQHRRHSQNMQQEPFAQATAGSFHPVQLMETFAEDVQRAFRHVRGGRGPTVLNVPLDVQHAELPPGWCYIASDTVTAGRQRPGPDRESMDTAATLIRASRRPAVVAGRGAVTSGARDAITAFADRIGAVLATTLPAKGWFAGHPFNVGIAGGFAHELGREVFSEADLVLAFGASLNLFTLGHFTLFPQAKLVQVELRPENVGETTSVDASIVGDARIVAEALLERASCDPAPKQFRTDRLSSRLAGYNPLDGVDFVGPEGGIDPREVALICDEALPQDRVLVIGVGHFSGYPSMHVAVQDPHDFILPWNFGAIGLAVPTAIGVAAAHPDRTTVAFEGDGSLMMSLAELDTAVRNRLPLLVIVLDDGAFGAETYMLRQHGLDPSFSFFDNPDFPSVARSLGLIAYNADDAHELRAALNDAIPVTHPTLIRVRLNQSVWLHEGFRALTG